MSSSSKIRKGKVNPIPNNEVTDPCSQKCAICLNAMHKLSGSLSCSHIFCFTCINQWAQTENSCPLCKFQFNEILKRNGNPKSKTFSRIFVTTKKQRVPDEPFDYSSVNVFDDSEEDDTFLGEEPELEDEELDVFSFPQSEWWSTDETDYDDLRWDFVDDNDSDNSDDLELGIPIWPPMSSTLFEHLIATVNNTNSASRSVTQRVIENDLSSSSVDPPLIENTIGSQANKRKRRSNNNSRRSTSSTTTTTSTTSSKATTHNMSTRSKRRKVD